MDSASRLARIAFMLRGRRFGTTRLPPLLAFTDPQRTSDPCAVANALPRGSGLVYRAFGAADAETVAARLARICRRRRVALFIGADARLQKKVGAIGLHLPERAVGLGPRGNGLATAAAHSPRALAAACRAGSDAAVLSPVFPSNSSSAGRPLGPWKAGHWARRAGLPVYALGGIDAARARRLPRSTFIGVAAIDGLWGPVRIRT